jgi:hypothetical protein
MKEKNLLYAFIFITHLYLHLKQGCHVDGKNVDENVDDGRWSVCDFKALKHLHVKKSEGKSTAWKVCGTNANLHLC